MLEIEILKKIRKLLKEIWNKSGEKINKPANHPKTSGLIGKGQSD